MAATRLSPAVLRPSMLALQFGKRTYAPGVYISIARSPAQKMAVGFEGIAAEATGRPGYHPGLLLKIRPASRWGLCPSCPNP